MRKFAFMLMLLFSSVAFADDTVQNVNGKTFDVISPQPVKVQQGLTLAEIDQQIADLQYQSDTALKEITRLQGIRDSAIKAGALSDSQGIQFTTQPVNNVDVNNA